ncbi:MAG: amidohydrolase family protein [Phycisphaerae bacterium]
MNGTPSHIVRRVFLTAGLLGLCMSAGAAVAADGGSVVLVRGAELYLGNGAVVHNGALLIEDGVIRAVGNSLPVPSGANVVELDGACVTPGLIDANASLEPTDVMTPGARGPRRVLHDFFCGHHGRGRLHACCGSTCPNVFEHASGKTCTICGFPNARPQMAAGTRLLVSLTEQSSEVVPHLRVIDTVNLRSPDLTRLLAGGVTTVYVSPDSAAVIGAQGAIVRTGGPLQDRIVSRTGAVKAVMGSDPFSRGPRNNLPFRKDVSFHSRRPTTRMGVAWVFRKALYDTKRFEQGVEVQGADVPSVAAMQTLSNVLSGDIPLRIQARKQYDILSAIRLAAEFGLSFVLEEATEASRCLPEIKDANLSVVYGPLFITPTGYRSYSGEAGRARLHTMGDLLAAGIETALTANDLRDEDGLARQAMYAIRYGVSPGDALQSVTKTPAKLLGLDREIGTLEVGKRGDVVVWSGEPFTATSRPVVVLIGGEIVYDRREG